MKAGSYQQPLLLFFFLVKHLAEKWMFFKYLNRSVLTGESLEWTEVPFEQPFLWGTTHSGMLIKILGWLVVFFGLVFFKLWASHLGYRFSDSVKSTKISCTIEWHLHLICRQVYNLLYILWVLSKASRLWILNITEN